MITLITKTCRPLLLFCTLSTGIARGQSPIKDDLSMDSAAYAAALNQYHAYLTPETALYRGDEYVAYVRTLKAGYPYYGENSARIGTVMYNGVLYRNVSLYYDLVYDVVVMDDFYHTLKIHLFGPQIDYFTIERHYFVNLRDSLNPSAPHNGFYEQLYKGRIQLLKKERKTIQDDLSEDVVLHFIAGTDTAYYLKIGATYHAVNTTGSLLKALKDRKKDTRKYMRANNLSMRHDRENTLIKVVAWYDTTQ